MSRLPRTVWVLALSLGLWACRSPRTITTLPPAPPDETTEVHPVPTLPDTLDRLPLDPAVRKGTLVNGLTYYIRPNERPRNRAELRLVLNAGSILEDEDQRGLAHVVEHMAFNGTTNFEKQALVDYLESVGTRFGPDLNAYTSFDETVYMLKVRTDSTKLLETGFQILRDWAGEVSFEPEEIDKERGVVVEEWRLGRGADARMQDKQFPILLQGSHYANRLPIGTAESLKSFTHEALVRYYRDWYRPDLMAVVAVGDFDPTDIETYIKTLFGDLVNPATPRPRTTHPVPGHPETLFAEATDPEAAYASIGVLYKHDAKPDPTTSGYRKFLTQMLYDVMLNTRLGELTQQVDPPYLFAGAGLSSFVRGKDFYSLNAVAPEARLIRALTTLLTEAERVRRHGFTTTELERQKAELLRQFKRGYAERDKTESARYAGIYVGHFLEETPTPGIERAYAMAQDMLPSITLEEVNALASRWITDENRVITVDGPEKPGVTLPTQADVLAVFDSIDTLAITPYEDAVSDAPLVPDVPVPAAIIETQTDSVLGVTRITLENGVRLVMKPTDFKNDQVIFSATSPGGNSLAPDEGYIPALFADDLIGQSGVGTFGPIELEKKLAGKALNVSPTIGAFSEGFNGSASPEDLETLFQLIHLYVVAPRADSTAYASYKQRLGDLVLGYKASPENAFRDTITVTMAQYHPRRRPFTQATLDAMDLEGSLRFYQDRFADLSDFTFYFVGTFDVDQLQTLAATYLGTLPDINREETWRDTGIRPPDGVIEKTIRKGLEPKSRVNMAFTGPFEWGREQRLELFALTQVMNIKLREVMREDLSGTYGVRISGSSVRDPEPLYRINISFGCDPERVEELTQTIFTQIDSLQTFGIDVSYLEKVRETSLRSHETNLRENGYWLRSLQYADRYTQDPRLILEGSANILATFDEETIQQAARAYLNPQRYARFVLMPE